MNLPVIILPEAEENILAVAKWWAENRSVEQAERWYDGILDAIDSLEINPDRCPPARENAKFPYDIRELHFGLGSHPTHRVIYTVRPDSVVVLSVRHAAQQDLAEDDLP